MWLVELAVWRVWMHSLQGNGHEHDFMYDDNVYVMDVYNFDIYPHDQRAKRTLLTAELSCVE